MFKSLFNRTKKTQEKSNTQEKFNEHKHYFSLLVKSYLVKNGFIQEENLTWNSEVEENIKRIQSALSFEDNIEWVIIEEWNLVLKENRNIIIETFLETFYNKFHNYKISKYAPDYVQERNIKIEKAYDSSIETITRIQGWLDDKLLRSRIESDTLSTNENFSTIKMCSTPFCIISLGSDTLGRYSIVYSLDHRIIQMISNDFTSTLIRRIYEFTSGEMESFVAIGSLYEDCLTSFNNLLKRTEIETNHKVINKERNKEKSIEDMLSKIELKDNLD
ncbi:hypothetical protein MPF19_16620 [Polaribacter sp. Z014]|uniref:hypothetical protein n=1 Tax=Polaribacter sp. Z014 TaxID=2927126 RepID=UPI00202107A9|nr:hypothetical protein [Polaribacter sp. Z014]MCL7765049.1 hypothetical protein [Polaribacter sp. Z014]